MVGLTSVLATKAGSPIGGILFGHFGDRLGRRTGVTWSLIVTGITSLAVAVTPSFASIGIMAAVLIFVFRFISGIGFGGDYGTSSTWVNEAAHGSRWRGFWSSWIGSGTQLATIASGLSFTVAASVLPHAAFVQWGWRVIFLVGSLAALVGVIVRYRTAESPLFAELKAKDAIEKSPLVKAAKGNWGKIAMLSITFGAIFGVGNMVGIAGGQAYLRALHVPIPVITFSVAMSAVFTFFLGTGLAVLSDVFPRGRKWVLIGLMCAVALTSTVTYRLYESGSALGVIAGMISVFGITSSASMVLPSFLTDQFGTKTRSSGSGIAAGFGYLGSGLFTSPITPIIIALNGGSILASSATFVEVAIVSMLVCVVLMLAFRENKPADLAAVPE